VKICTLPDLKNSFVVEGAPVVDGYIILMCKNGFYFTDGTNKRTFVCLPGQDRFPKWHTNIEDCKGSVICKYCYFCCYFKIMQFIYYDVTVSIA
jgi:hypothetical protein